MSFIWSMSLNVLRDDILKDENIIITETEHEGEGEVTDTVRLKGVENTGGYMRYLYNTIDKKYHLYECGSHSGMAKILQYLHDVYGEVFMELDYNYYQYEYGSMEMNEIFEKLPKEQLNIIIKAYQAQYMLDWNVMEKDDKFIENLMKESDKVKKVLIDNFYVFKDILWLIGVDTESMKKELEEENKRRMDEFEKEMGWK